MLIIKNIFLQPRAIKKKKKEHIIYHGKKKRDETKRKKERKSQHLINKTYSIALTFKH